MFGASVCRLDGSRLAPVVEVWPRLVARGHVNSRAAKKKTPASLDIWRGSEEMKLDSQFFFWIFAPSRRLAT